MALECNALGSEFFGFQYKDCVLKCSSFKHLGPPAEPRLNCVAAALEMCSGVHLETCFSQIDNPCIYSMCDVGFAADCGLVPEYILTIEDCKDVCLEWTTGQILGWDACSTLGQSLGLECGQRVFDCMQVPPEPYEGILEYCTQFHQHCPTEEEYLGLLTDELCAWSTSGLLSLTGGQFDPQSANECLQQWSGCYQPLVGSGPGSTLPPVLTCATVLPENLLTACQQWVDQCTAPEPNIDGLMSCRSSLVYKQIQGTHDEVMVCWNKAQNCEEQTACFF